VKNPSVARSTVQHYVAGARATLPVLLGIIPFGVITGYVPAAVLTAIWAPEVLVQNEQLPAGVVAIAVAWRWRMTFATIIAGLLALHFFAWLM
jgi:branched-subunit amino acid transport protein